MFILSLTGTCRRTGCTACQVPPPHKGSGNRAAISWCLHHRFSYGCSRRAVFYARHSHPGPVKGLPRKKCPLAPYSTEMRPDLPLTWAAWERRPEGPARDSPGASPRPSRPAVHGFSLLERSLPGFLLEAAVIGDILNLLIISQIFIRSIDYTTQFLVMMYSMIISALNLEIITELE